MCFKLARLEEFSLWKRPEIVPQPDPPATQASPLCNTNLGTMLGASARSNQTRITSGGKRVGPLLPEMLGQKLAQLPSALLFAPVLLSLAEAWHSANDRPFPLFFLQLKYSGSAPLCPLGRLKPARPRHLNCTARTRHRSLSHSLLLEL